MNLKKHGLLTDDELKSISCDVIPEYYDDIKGIGTALKGYSAAKAGSYAGAAAGSN